MDLDPIEDIAESFLRRVRYDVGDVVPLDALARAHGLSLVPVAPRGCRGMIAGGVLHFDGTTRTLAHELAHRACDLYGLPRPHDERTVIAVAARLVSPRAAVRRAIRSGADYRRIAHAFRVKGTCAVLRVGEVTGEPVAIITRTTVLARGEWQWPPADVLRRMVRSKAKWLRVEPIADDPKRLIVRPAA